VSGKVFVIDTDGTLRSLTDGKYQNAVANQARIHEVNQLYDAGNTIILFTARGMGRNNNNANEAVREFEQLTLNQIQSWGLKYHRIFFGKPAGDFYIDDKAVNAVDFFD
jgi:phosphosulfolactate synthase (CoM biosynthesis protein A)